MERTLKLFSIHQTDSVIRKQATAYYSPTCLSEDIVEKCDFTTGIAKELCQLVRLKINKPRSLRHAKNVS